MSGRGALESAAIMVYLVASWPLRAFARWWRDSDTDARRAFLLLFGLWMTVAIERNLAANERQQALAQAMSPSGRATTEAAMAEFLQHDLAQSGYESGEGGELLPLRARPAPTSSGEEPLYQMLKLIQEGASPEMASEQAYGSGAPQIFAFSAPTLGEPRVPNYDPAEIGPAPSHPCAQKWWPEIVAAGKKHNVDPLLIVQFMGNESACNKEALSPVGARGLMQIMPATGREIQNQCGENAAAVWEPGVNISLGACYIRMMADYLTGGRLATYDEVFIVAAAYNCGPGCAASGRLPGETIPYANAIASAFTRR